MREFILSGTSKGAVPYQIVPHWNLASRWICTHTPLTRFIGYHPSMTDFIAMLRRLPSFIFLLKYDYFCKLYLSYPYLIHKKRRVFHAIESRYPPPTKTSNNPFFKPFLSSYHTKFLPQIPQFLLDPSFKTLSSRIFTTSHTKNRPKTAVPTI